jgi:hypothetical protein
VNREHWTQERFQDLWHQWKKDKIDQLLRKKIQVQRLVEQFQGLPARMKPMTDGLVMAKEMKPAENPQVDRPLEAQLAQARVA